MVKHVLIVLTALIVGAIAVPNKVPKKECRQLMDLVFVFDGSDSINAIDYQKQRLALASIIQELEIGPTRVNVGYVVYSSNIAQVLNLTGDRSLLNHTAYHLDHPRDGTHTHSGIAAMIKMFQDWGREKVPYVCFTITDGISKWPKKTATQAALARKMGVNMFAVGISHTILTKELDAIASSPDQVYELTSFDQLRSALSSIMKVVCPCPIPDKIPFATISEGTRVIDVNRTYTCDPRYQPLGNPIIVCRKNATWTPTDFGCHVCPKPMPKQANAVLVPGQPKDFLLGATREYVCIKGFTYPVPRIITCEPTPEGPRWTDLLEPCVTCKPRKGPLNAVPLVPIPNPIIGDMLEYACVKGYHPNGPLATKCVDNKGVPEWTGIDAGCITCLEPPPRPHAIVDNTGLVMVDSMRKYACIEGYHATGPLEAMCVGKKYSTYWEMNNHKCITCDLPMEVPNARLVSNMSVLVNTELLYVCNDGYQETGPIAQICRGKNGKTFWVGPDYGCVACPNPMPKQNNAVLIPGQPKNRLIGTTMEYACIDGYAFPEPIIIMCEPTPKGPRWTPVPNVCAGCPPQVDPAYAIPNVVIKHPLVGDTIMYTCDKGYYPNGPMETKCIKDRGLAVWIPINTACITCLEPPPRQHAIVDNTGLVLVNSIRTYACIEGYHATGPLEAMCVGKKYSTYWEMNNHKCITCDLPMEVPNARLVSNMNVLVNTELLYACNDGYQETGPIAQICRGKNGKTFWVGTQYGCVACPNPMPKQNNAVLIPGQPANRLIGTTMEYACIDGYAFPEPIIIMCEPTPKGPRWTPVPDVCAGCPPQIDPAFAIPNVVIKHPLVGDTIMYTCDKGYYPNGPMETKCIKDRGLAVWIPINTACITCLEPPPRPHAIVDNTGLVLVDSMRKYACVEGYHATGPLEAMCVGKKYSTYWEMNNHKCITCDLPMEVLNARLVSNMSVLVNTELLYACNKGYQATGPIAQTCRGEAGKTFWVGPHNGCVACPNPMPKKNNAVLIPGQPANRLIGTTMEYACIDGYAFPEPIIIMCEPSPKGPRWTPVPDVCAGCPPQIDPAYAIPNVVIKHPLVGDTIMYKCDSGYVPNGPMQTKCVNDRGLAVWTPINTACVTCSEPPARAHAIVDKVGNVLVNAVRTYVCKDGFHPTGPLLAKCVAKKYSARWELTKNKCITCNPPKGIAHTRMETPMSVLVGTQLIYSCHKGYQATGPIAQICKAEAGKTFWIGPDYGCVTCLDPPVIPNAVLSGSGDTLVGSVRRYKCVNDHINTGPIEVGCVKGPSKPLWTTSEYKCVICDMPPPLPNTNLLLDIGSNKVGHFREYECLPGYVPSKRGNIKIQCIGQYLKKKGRAVWGKPSHYCEACSEPPTIDHGIPEPGLLLVGESRRYKCLDGFYATGPIISYCMNTTKWSKPKHSCTACGPKLPKVKFAQPLKGRFVIGTVREYRCFEGYVPNNTPAVKCLRNATWSLPNFQCYKCKKAYPLKNGVVEPGPTFVKTVRTYTCLPGYLATGVINSTCYVADGAVLPDWSVPAHYCKDCGKPRRVKFAKPLKGRSTLGAKQMYECKPGYVPSGPPYIECMPNAEWDIARFKCITCEEPPYIANAEVDKVGGVLKGSIRTYACTRGYKATGPIEYKCWADLTPAYPPPYWTNLTMNYCKDCGEPLPITNGGWLPGAMTIGSTAHYICDTGYAPNGPPEAICQETTLWTEPNFKCTGCFFPPIQPYAQIKGYKDGDMALVGHFYEYVCLLGYKSAGVVKATCLDSLTWVTSPYSCGGCEKTMVPMIANGEVVSKVKETSEIGAEVFYECHKGFLNNSSPTTRCLDTLQWSKPAFECVKTCYDPPVYGDAAADVIGGIFVGDRREYTCRPDLHGFGDLFHTCLPSGQWSERAFRCYVCVNPPIPPHAIILDSGPRYIGERVHYECKPGYAPTGTNITTCLADGNWSPLLIGCSNCQVAPKVHLAKLAYEMPMTGIEIGQTISYDCLHGYFSAVPVSVMCQPDLTWSFPSSACKGCNISLIPGVENSLIVTQLTDMAMVGTSITYKCASGFLHTDKPHVVCLDTLQWSGPLFRCEITCHNPPEYGDAAVDVIGGIFLGDRREYTCKPELYGFGDRSITCLPSGQWSERAFQCFVCVDPPIAPHTFIMDPGPRYLGELVHYECEAGYAPTGKNFTTCLAGGNWSPLLIGCSNCRIPAELPYAKMSMVFPTGGVLIGQPLLYDCWNGYRSDMPVTVICEPDLNWSPATSFCRGCEKQFIPLIPHANLTKHPPAMAGVGTILPFECDMGFLPTSTPEVVCTETLLWSEPKFRCLISCGTPPHYPYTKIDMIGGIIEGSVRVYTCDPGMSLVGKGTIMCLPTGHWSPKKFDCRVCDPPPELEYALPTVNTSTVGFEVVYKCKNGYLSKKPVKSICLPDLTWSIPMNNCTDCGPPPDKPNAYMGLGATRIGTERKYACISGYEMYRGNGVIKCLPTGVWSDTSFSCNVKTTTTTTTPAPVVTDPSVCDQCRMLNGVGFNPHPLDCSKFVQCHYGPSGGVVATYMPCGYGEFWYQKDLSCLPSKSVDCPYDPCLLNPNLKHYKSTDNTKCCAYWVCVNGKSVPRCCGDGQRYKTGKGCVPDPECVAVCPEKDYYPVCNQRPVKDKTRYEVHIGDGYWVNMPCAYGTIFDPVECECIRSPDFVPGYVCRPELKLDFEDDTERDNSGKNVYVMNQGVRTWRGAGYFNGSARLLINRFSNTPFNNYLVIKMRYKEDLRGPAANSLQALLTNGDCGDDPSLLIAKMPGFVLLGVHTDSPRSFALPTVNSEWKEVILIHDEKKLSGNVCGASYSKWSYGPIKATHCGIQIGYGTKLPNFVGWIDDFLFPLIYLIALSPNKGYRRRKPKKYLKKRPQYKPKSRKQWKRKYTKPGKGRYPLASRKRKMPPAGGYPWKKPRRGPSKFFPGKGRKMVGHGGVPPMMMDEAYVSKFRPVGPAMPLFQPPRTIMNPLMRSDYGYNGNNDNGYNRNNNNGYNRNDERNMKVFSSKKFFMKHGHGDPSQWHNTPPIFAQDHVPPIMAIDRPPLIPINNVPHAMAIDMPPLIPNKYLPHAIAIAVPPIRPPLFSKRMAGVLNGYPASYLPPHVMPLNVRKYHHK